MVLFTSFFDSEHKLVINLSILPISLHSAYLHIFLHIGKKVYENIATITNICFILNPQDTYLALNF